MDIKYHGDKILSLESKIDSLLSIADNIEKSNGMTKAFALEAMELVPGFGKGVPMAYYSTEPSIAQHAVALEELSGAIIAAIIAATVALIAMIVKFISWLFGDKLGKGIASSKSLEKAEEVYSERAKLDNELETTANRLLSNNTAAMEDHYVSARTRPRNINELLDEYVKHEGNDSELARVLRADDPLFHDVIYQGEYTRTIKSTSGAIAVIPVSVKEAATKYLKLVTDVETNLHHLRSATDEFQEIDADVKPIMMDIFGSGKRISLDESVLHMAAVREKVRATTPTDARISFTKLNSLFSQALNKTTIANIVKKIENTKNAMEELLSKLAATNSKIEKINTGSEQSEITTKYYGLLRNGFKTTRVDIINCFRFFHELMQYATILHNMDLKLTAVHKSAVRVIEAEIKKTNGGIPDEFKLICDRYNETYSYQLN